MKHEDNRNDDNYRMYDKLPPGVNTVCQPICVCVPSREQDLKKQHRGSPHCWRPSKPGQEDLPDHWLDLKEEKCGEEDAKGEENHSDYEIELYNNRSRNETRPEYKLGACL